MARYHILIVDDQYEVRKLLHSSLDTLRLDLEVLDVPSAEEALLILGKEQIDLLITDIRLPGMSGLELRAHAGRRMPTTQLILITGYSDEKIQDQIAQADVAAYFYKPIQINPFLDAVCRCLGVGNPGASNQDGPHPIVVPENDSPAPANPLSGLSANPAVLGAVLLARRGKPLATCGCLVDQKEIQKYESATLSLLEQDRRQVQSIPGTAFPCHHLFSGQVSSLWVSSLGPNLALVVVLLAGEAAHEAAGLMHEITMLRAGLVGLDLGDVALSATGTVPQASQNFDEAVDSELSELLGQASRQPFLITELDEFWEPISQEDQPAARVSQGILSYEEALSLGLTPGENLT